MLLSALNRLFQEEKARRKTPALVRSCGINSPARFTSLWLYSRCYNREDGYSLLCGPFTIGRGPFGTSNPDRGWKMHCASCRLFNRFVPTLLSSPLLLSVSFVETLFSRGLDVIYNRQLFTIGIFIRVVISESFLTTRRERIILRFTVVTLSVKICYQNW